MPRNSALRRWFVGAIASSECSIRTELARAEASEKSHREAGDLNLEIEAKVTKLKAKEDLAGIKTVRKFLRF